jgi:hypothetical protein
MIGFAYYYLVCKLINNIINLCKLIIIDWSGDQQCENRENNLSVSMSETQRGLNLKNY